MREPVRATDMPFFFFFALAHFKPADLVPGSAHALAEIIVRAGIPKGVFNLVMGRGSVVGQAMLDHPESTP